MKVAIQGERGSFSHQAVMELLPKAQIVPCSRSVEVFDALDSNHADCAVLPVENTLAGSVGENIDLLLERKIFVQREHRVRIEHNLMAMPGVGIDDLREVLSHPVALDQCRNFFRRHPKILPAAFYDTAGSVKHLIAKKLTSSGAIAGRQAAKEYGAKILMSGLEDEKQNFTRFFLLQKRKKVLPGADKTSIVYSLRNVAGALFKSLSVFALRDLDLSKIESRPVRGKPWEYVFYMDILRGQDEAMRKALDHLGEIAGFVKVLGIYPQAK
jgi:prephenate dehydratase